MRKEISQKFLDAVLHHVTHHENDEKRPGDVSVLDLSEPGHCSGKNHCQTSRQAITDLLDSHSVLLLVKPYVEFALDELL